MREECGVFGISLPGEQVARSVYFGLFALQHRGQESAGIAVANGEGFFLKKGVGLVNQVFRDYDALSQVRGDIGIGHVRYSTTGSTLEGNAQPLLYVGLERQWRTLEPNVDGRGNGYFRYVQGPGLALAHNGNIVNAVELRTELEGQGLRFETSTDSEVIVNLVARSLQHRQVQMGDQGELLRAVYDALRKLRGAYALVVLTPGFLIGVRDPAGIRPLCLGQLNGGHVLASETCALDIVGATFVREVRPGECVLISPFAGATSDVNRRIPGRKRERLCIFELIYFARPDSEISGLLVQDVRERLGMLLAEEHPVSADFVIPVPDSGLPAAVGYARGTRLECMYGLIRNRYVLRTFIQPEQHLRDLGIKLKLNPLRKRIAGKSIVLIDDSIVRGTTTRQIVRLLKAAGAREVHMRVSCPPIRWPCYYGIDTSKRPELIASMKTQEEIRQYINADSLEYLSVKGLFQAVENADGSSYCTACFTGKYPVKIKRGASLDKLSLEELFPRARWKADSAVR